MDATALLVVGVVLLLTYLYLTSRKARNIPPGPLAIPFFGNIPFAEKHKRELHLKLIEMKEYYGDIVSVYIGQVPIVFLSSYDIIKEAIVDQADSFSDRPELMLRNIYRGNENIKEAIVGSSGERWRKVRKAVVVALRDMGVGKKTIENKIADEAGYIIDELQKHENKPFDMLQVITYAVSNIINGVVFGERFEYSDKKFQDIIEVMNGIFDVFPAGEPALYSPILSVLYAMDFKRGAGMDVLYNKMIAYHQEHIEQHRKTFDPDEIRDVIDICIAADKEDESDTTFSAQTVVGVVDDLFNAGSETTNTTLRWLFLRMLRHQDVQEKCFKEVEKVFGTERPPSYKDRAECHYINATLNENQRMSNIVPLSLMHDTAKDTTVGGYNIPKGSLVSYNMYAVHMDDKNFPKAHEFKPERWLDSQGRFKKLDKFFPFGAGRRACAGEHLAKIELFLFFTTLIQHYKFVPEKGARIPSDDEAKIGITRSPPRYKVVPVRR